MSDSYRAVVARQTDGKQSVAIETMAEQALPAGDVLVDIEEIFFWNKWAKDVQGQLAR